MSTLHTLSKSFATAALACGTFAASLPAVAGPIDWASWSNSVVGVTTGSATATFVATGISATYTGEVEPFAGVPSYGPAGTFSGGAVGNAPPQANGIVRLIGGAAAATNTITFSQAVVNPVLAIWSLGQPGNFIAQFNFNQAFTIEAGGPNAEFGGASIYAVGNTIFGAEGNGVIQFTGSLTSISWTNPVAEDWYGFTVGVQAAAVPEPETYALMFGGLGLLAFVARRRKPA